MERWTKPVLALVIALLAAACAAPESTDAWDVERVSPSNAEVAADTTICGDVRRLALGSHASDTELAPTLEELARIGAVVGATAALSPLRDLQAIVADDDVAGLERTARVHDLLLAAAAAIDDATAAACDVPAFSALYAASGFPDCHFEMEIGVGAYTLSGDAGTCSSAGRPTFLPCWSTDGAHLPIDCVSGEVVQAVGDRWEPAGAPDEIVIDRPIPVEPEAIPVVAPTGAVACATLTGLFQSGATPNGTVAEFDRLATAVAALDPATRALVAEFIDANSSVPSIADFETLVQQLDQVTADECGFPIVSAWASILEPVDQLPCWVETGIPYPAYTQADCT